MLRRKYVAAGFPILVLSLFMTERVVSYLLDIYPPAPPLWAASSELRALFRDSANWLDMVTGHSLPLQIASISGLAALIALATGMRQWGPVSFLINHATLLLLASMLVVGSGASVASSHSAPAARSYLLQGSQLGAIPVLVLSLGLVACAWCHMVVLAEARRRERTVSTAVRELAFDLEDRRQLRRNRPSHSR
ncbi:hypothetical protein MesoLjLc_49690 [Mesorhizobium sp. L-8-10]|uniref:hypothetical protein n=1 Tax=Mesorhizobium sp. L-8-10 TaxID=2744523 RepID=UPI001925A388|nr:hypothetical protein [Mesorhizobium sp. L-8-10]BCH33039.1 hypothetical protein MesoLjLc_49690 [Mesorhizobium sp. L-8-10]